MATVASYVWYELLRKLKNLPTNYFRYLEGSKICTITLRNNDISDAGIKAIALANSNLTSKFT